MQITTIKKQQLKYNEPKKLSTTINIFPPVQREQRQ